MKQPPTALVLGLVLLVCAPSPLFAYIDPGTGSLLVSTLLGIGIVLLYSAKSAFYRILAGIYGRGFKGKNDFSGKIVFFCEGKNYWNVFKPVIDALLLKQVALVYLSADKDDLGLLLESPLVETHYIGNMHAALLFLKSLKADMCVMTTPQLNILMLRRSKEVRHYCHIIHSPDDIHTYKKFAFDYFDSVLCSSSFQIDNLRELEQLRNKPKKQLYATGCTYYDSLPVKLPAEPASAATESCILLAPTWGEKSFLALHGKTLLDMLLAEGYRIIFRPHPQSWISDKALLDMLLTKYTSSPQFECDDEVDNYKAMARTSCMICDLSGIVYDYVCVHKKPVIAVIAEPHLKGYEGYNLSQEQSVVSLANRAGRAIRQDEIATITQIIPTLLSPKTNLEESSVINSEMYSEIVDKHIFNFRSAGRVAADQLMQIFEAGQQ